MRKLAATAAAVLLLTAPSSADPPSATPEHARTVLTHTLAPLLAYHGHARVEIVRCRGRACRFRLHGTARCRGIMQIRETEETWVAWVSRLYCRSRDSS